MNKMLPLILLAVIALTLPAQALSYRAPARRTFSFPVFFTVGEEFGLSSERSRGLMRGDKYSIYLLKVIGKQVVYRVVGPQGVSDVNDTVGHTRNVQGYYVTPLSCADAGEKGYGAHFMVTK